MYFNSEDVYGFEENECEASAVLLEKDTCTEAGPEIVEGMNAADNQHLRFFRVYIYFILLKNNRRKHYYATFKKVCIIERTLI